MSSAVGEQRIGDEIGFVDRRVAHLTGPIGPEAQSLERSIDVVQRRFDRYDAFITELWHVYQLT
jgi:hypothetical protein